MSIIKSSKCPVAADVSPVYKQESGWNAMLPKRFQQSRPSTSRFATIIIGAGYTGLAAARRIAELRPNENVLVIEASTIGEGSAGRNSGFIIDLPHNTKMGGHTSPLEIARKQIRMYNAGRNWLKQLVDEHRIDCGWNPAGKYHAAAGSEGAASLCGVLNQYKEWGIPFTEFDRDGLQEKLGSSYYQYGFHSPNNVFVQPAALIRGLADSLPKNVVILENEAVVTLEESKPFLVKTVNGEYKSDRVIIANNGFAAKLGILRDRIFTIFTYAAVTPRLSEEELASLGNCREWGVIPANRLGTTMRRIQDGRMMVRSAYSYEREQPTEKTRALLTDAYRRRFPNMNSCRFEYIWGGTTALTRNGASYFGELRKGLYVSVGCNGAGVLKGSVFGKLLGEMAMGLDSVSLADVLSFDGPNWLPPDPIRKIAITSAIRYQAVKAGPER